MSAQTLNRREALAQSPGALLPCRIPQDLLCRSTLADNPRQWPVIGYEGPQTDQRVGDRHPRHYRIFLVQLSEQMLAVNAGEKFQEAGCLFVILRMRRHATTADIHMHPSLQAIVSFTLAAACRSLSSAPLSIMA